MNSREEKDVPLRSYLQGGIESPFLEADLFVEETEDEWEARLAVLEAESPFRSAFEQGQPTLIEPEELEEEFVAEQERAEADDFAFRQGDLNEFGQFSEHEAWETVATLEFEAAGCTGDHELLEFEGELLDSEIWQGTAAQIAFQDKVLNAHIALSRKKHKAAKRDLSPEELDKVPGTKIQMGLEPAVAAGRLLAAANADLGKAQAVGHADALRTIRLSATSGYRGSTHQRQLWLKYFSAKGGYYDLTQTAREKFADGPHSKLAITYMLTPLKKGGFGLGGRIAAPGFSNHQGGIAIDFCQERKKGHEILNNSRKAARDKWRSTWFWADWLKANAVNFGFQPIPTEEWHWEYRPGSGATETTSAATSLSQSTAKPIVSPPAKGAQPGAERVCFAQRVLNGTEGERLSDDGDLGRLTHAALERFRKKYGLGLGGVLDASTELALAQRAIEELAQASMFAQLGTRDARTEQALITFKSKRQLGMDAKLDPETRRALTDALARMTPKPISPSIYLGGKLWTFDSKMLPTRVAVFCPQAALSMREVEVLMYAHGLLTGCTRPKSIPDGMITDEPFKLGNIVAASGRPIVLVVPYLDWANPGGESAFGSSHRKWHALGKPANLNSLIAEVLGELGRVQSIATPSLRNLVIAGHSRAYDLLEPLTHSHSDPQMQQGPLARLSQVWALDTTYAGNVSKWMSWLDANPGLRVNVFYKPGSKTGTVGDEFYHRRSAKLAVFKVPEDHCSIPARRLPTLLKPTVSAIDQETEAPWGEDELESDEANLEVEASASEAYNQETVHGKNAIDAEFDRELDGEAGESFELAEEHIEVDRFDPLNELDADEQQLSAEPEFYALAFEALGSDDEHVSDYEEEEFEFEEEDYADQELEEEAYGFEQETFLEPEAPPASEVVFPSGGSLRVVSGYPEGKDEEFWDPTGSGNPLLDTGPAHKEKKLSKNFTVRELTTSGGVSADIARIDPKLVGSIQRLRDHLGKSVTITSGYRSWKRNEEVYAKRSLKPTLSQHCGGRGADIKIKGMNGLEIGKAAIDACGPNIGVGLGNTFAHIDMRGNAEVWNYGGVQSDWIEEIKNYQQAKEGKRKPSPRAAQPLNDLVRFAQQVLNAAEGERLRDDADLGQLTRGALERFRKKYNLGTGGVLDGKTQLALAQRAIEEIRQQSLFGQLGVLDVATREALITFNSQRGLVTDATFDAATRAALADALARRAIPIATFDSPAPAQQAPKRVISVIAGGTQISAKVIAAVERYRPLADAAAAKYSVDSALILGLIAAESGGNKDLVAKSGYTGLMQADKGEDHKQPATSINVGTKKLRDFRVSMEGVLKQRGQRYDRLPETEQLRLLALAYNAGPVTVAKALQYAAEAGSPERWLDAVHYKRALLFTGAYSLKQAARSCLKGISQSEQDSRMREAVRIWNQWRLGTKKTTWRKLDDPPAWSTVSANLPSFVLCAIDFKHRNSPKYAAKILAYRNRFQSG